NTHIQSQARIGVMQGTCDEVVAECCDREVPQVGGGGSAADLSSSDGGRSPTATGGDDPEVDILSQLGPGVATELGSDHALFPLSGRHSQGDLHHQQRGGVASLVAQDY